MPKFSDRSNKNLNECHPDLQILARVAIEKMDFTVICGHRGEEAQNKAYNEGNSKVRYPQSKHNLTPSMAFDFIPAPFKGWDDKRGFERIGKYLVDLGVSLKILGSITHDVEWGGNWKWKDYPHIQLK